MRALSCWAIGVRTLTNRPGSSAPSLLSNTARAVSVPVAKSTWGEA
jgi:hypothetical protein